MKAPTTVEELFELYEARGHQHYGEFITQIEHALQCAALARTAGAGDELIAAALLHDAGHLVADVQGSERFRMDKDDDGHEALGARVLSPLLGVAVAQPVALHVIAKRWRCTRDSLYHERLSPASRATLTAQGGLLTQSECARFESHPGFLDALALRTWDDAGKTPGLDVGCLRDYEELITRLAAAR